MAIEGIVTCKGVPQPGSRVFLLDAADEPLGGAVAGDDGRFEIDAPAGVGSVLVAGCGARAFGVAVRELPEPPEQPVVLELTDSGDLWPLTVTLEGEVPERFQISLAASRIDGLALRRLAAVYGPIGEMTAGTLGTHEFEGSSSELLLQGGDWRAYPGWEEVYAARAVGDEDRVWHVTRAWLDSEELDASEGHVDFRIAGPASLRLEVACLVRGVASG